MPIVTLLNELKNGNKKFDIIAYDNVVIKNQTLDMYDLGESSLWLFTGDKHEITIDVSNFKKIDFDAIVYEAESSRDMMKCLTALEDKGSYNAYLRDSKNNHLIGFYHIREE